MLLADGWRIKTQINASLRERQLSQSAHVHSARQSLSTCPVSWAVLAQLQAASCPTKIIGMTGREVGTGDWGGWVAGLGCGSKLGSKIIWFMCHQFCLLQNSFSTLKSCWLSLRGWFLSYSRDGGKVQVVFETLHFWGAKLWTLLLQGEAVTATWLAELLFGFFPLTSLIHSCSFLLTL